MINLFLYALFLTISIETIALFVIRKLWFFDLKKIDYKKILFVWFFTSFATLPYLWFVLGDFLIWNYLLYTIIWEFFVVFMEAIIFYFVLNYKNFLKAFLLSFIVNFVSWFIGLYII